MSIVFNSRKVLHILAGRTHGEINVSCAESPITIHAPISHPRRGALIVWLWCSLDPVLNNR